MESILIMWFILLIVAALCCQEEKMLVSSNVLNESAQPVEEAHTALDRDVRFETEELDRDPRGWGSEQDVA